MTGFDNGGFQKDESDPEKENTKDTTLKVRIFVIKKTLDLIFFYIDRPRGYNKSRSVGQRY